MRSKTKKKNKNKRKVKVQGNKFSLWLEKHRVVEAFLNFLVLIVVAIGVGYLTFGNESIPAPLRHFNYISPLCVNLLLLVLIPYYSRFGSLRKEGFTSLKVLAEGFLYLNGPVFLIHYYIGIRSKGGKPFAPPLISLDSRYVWFPIATYILFFSIAGLATLIAIYLERKKKCHVPKKQS